MNVVAMPHTIATNAITFRTRDANGRVEGALIGDLPALYCQSRPSTDDRHPARSADLHLRRLDSRRRAAVVARVALVPPIGPAADAGTGVAIERSGGRITRAFIGSAGRIVRRAAGIFARRR